MGAPNSPFNVAQAISSNIGGAFEKRRDDTAIERILGEAMQSDDPEVLQNSIGQILSQVSPERRGDAVQFLQGAMQRAQAKQQEQRQREGVIRAGIDPDLPTALQVQQLKNQSSKKEKGNLTLNESLNQAEKRYKTRIANLKTPFEKRDAFGSIFLDFEDDEKKRKEVLTKLNKELKDYAQELKRTYLQYGEMAPQDIEDQLKEEIDVSVNGQKMSLKMSEQIDEFEKKNPAKKHKGKKAQDEEGNIFISDGITWKLIE